MMKRQLAGRAFQNRAPMKIILHSSPHHADRAVGHNEKPQIIHPSRG